MSQLFNKDYELPLNQNSNGINGSSYRDDSPESNFVPSIFLSNTMSLAPKIDEIAHTLINVDADIALFTETWLSGCVPDSPINIKGYQLFRRDRVGWQHGGVCMYVKDSTQCKVLSDLHHEDHEANCPSSEGICIREPVPI